jgi:hypothetical protein
MRRPIALLVVLLITQAGCGGGGSDKAVMDALPDLVPTLAEVQALFPDRAEDPAEIQGGFLSPNETDPVVLRLYDRLNASQLTARGRVASYWTRYIIGEQNPLTQSTSGVSILLDLYKDEESAAAEVTLLPERGIRSGADPALGDQSMAWGYQLWTAPSGIEPQCPCQFRFRVGRIVGWVDPWRPRFQPFAAYPYPDFDPIAHELAALIADRISKIDQS